MAAGTGMIYQHTHQGPFDPPSQPGFPGAVPPPPGYGYRSEGYMQQQPQSYQGYGGGDYNPPHPLYPQPQHIGHEQRYGDYYQGDGAYSSFLRTCLATLCCCFICQECCFI